MKVYNITETTDPYHARRSAKFKGKCEITINSAGIAKAIG